MIRKLINAFAVDRFTNKRLATIQWFTPQKLHNVIKEANDKLRYHSDCLAITMMVS